jgi:hypothetical protein
MNRLCLMIVPLLVLAPLGRSWASSSDACFQSRQYRGFKAIDAHEFYVRAGAADLYRVTVEGSCPALLDPQAYLITKISGGERICGPLDWDLRIAQPGPGGVQVPCIVKSQTRLSAPEAAAVPKDLRP